MRTIAVLNQKGGVGKTTTTVNTAAALAVLGQRVIVIDLDPQAHLTIHLGVEPQSVHPGSYEVLTQSTGFEESLMMVRPNLWLLGANINLVGAETELVNVVGREIILREAMESSQEHFDFCLIDCAPSLGLLSLNALAASQEVLIPLQPHFLALQGFGKLLQTVDLVNKRINPNLKVSGVLLCMFDTRASLPNEVRADIERFLDNARGSACAWADAQLLPTFIRRNIKLAEAPSYGQTVFEYDPTCNGAEDYKRVGRFFLGAELEPEAELESESEPEFAPEVEPQAATPTRENTRVEWEPQAAPAEPELGVTSDEMDELIGGAVEPVPLEGESAPTDGVDAIVESELESWAGHAAEPQVPHEPQEPQAEPEQVPSADLPASPEPPMQNEPAEIEWGYRDPAQGQVEPQAESEGGSKDESDLQGENKPEASDDSSEPTPIQIREFQPPRRYCPPPLKTYPIPPSQRSQEPGSQEESPRESRHSQDESEQTGF